MENGNKSHHFIDANNSQSHFELLTDTVAALLILQKTE